MAESCVLRLCAADGADGAAHGSAQQAEWVLVDGAGTQLSATARGALSEAAAAVAGRRLVALAPGPEVVLAAPELPARGAARLLQLAPFALEDQLATEVDALHFAVGRQGSDRRVPVAAVDRQGFTAWLKQLADAGLAPAAVYAESLTVPDNPGHVVVVIESGRVVVRRPGMLPLTLDATPLDEALAVAGLPGDAAGGAATHVLVYVTTAEWERHRATIEALRDAVATLNVQLLPDSALPVLAAGAVTAPPFSLLQGEFARREGFASAWPRWRTAVLLFAAFAALHLATLGIDGWRLHRDETRLTQQLHSAAAEALPNVQNLDRLPSLRAAVDGRLHRVRASVGEGLLGALGVVAGALGTVPDTRLQSVSYRDGVTELTLDAPDVGAIDRVQQAVKERGFGAEVQGASQKDQRYQGRVQLKGPG
jgi:general secretion pathway protein L